MAYRIYRFLNGEYIPVAPGSDISDREFLLESDGTYTEVLNYHKVGRLLSPKGSGRQGFGNMIAKRHFYSNLADPHARITGVPYWKAADLPPVV
jgi:hypothetical protein